MKRLLPLLLICSLLTACSQTPSLLYEGEGWSMTESEAPEVFDLSKQDSLCMEVTNVGANLWTEETDTYKLAIIECMHYTVIKYVSDGTLYEISADTLQYALDGLSQFLNASTLIEEEPYVFTQTAVVTYGTEEDGWGYRVLDGVEYPWPQFAASTTTGWQTDDASFEITPYTEMEDATEDLEAIKNSIIANGIEDFKMWYFENGTYQGLAWLLDGEYYISLAKYGATGSDYLVLTMQRDCTQAYDLAERYDMSNGMEGLLQSDPIFET